MDGSSRGRRIRGGVVLKANVAFLVAAIAIAAAGPAPGASERDYADCSQTDDTDRGIAACSRIIDGAGETPVDRSLAYLNRGNGYAAAGKLDQAIADYGAAIALDPQSVLGYSSRSIAYARKGDRDRAIADFRQANRLDSAKVSAMTESSAELKEIGTAVAQADRAANEAACKDALEHWKSAESIGTRAAFQAHLDLYPTCNFASLARARIAALDSSAPPPPVTAAPPPSDAERPSGSRCGWYAIFICSKSRTEAANWPRERHVGFVISTDSPGYPNFRAGWYCAVEGPMSRSRALQEADRLRPFAPTAYAKNAC
jgi:tetratricopeptide (TPR) repeat protein